MLEWTVQRQPVPLKDLPIYQLYYLSVCSTPSDPTIVWGTEVRMEPLEAYLRQKNSMGEVLLSPAHFLFRNVGLAMHKHAEFNRRVARRRVFEYKQVNVLVPIFNRGGSEINTMLLEGVPDLSLEEIAKFMWERANAAAQGSFDNAVRTTWFEQLPKWLVRLGLFMHVWNHNTFNFPRMSILKRENVASMLVNYYGSKKSPPMTSYKPSRFPLDGVPFSVTMGATVDQPVVENGQVVPGRVAPLYLRADHRIVDAYLMKGFLETLLQGFAHPESLERSTTIPLRKAS